MLIFIQKKIETSNLRLLESLTSKGHQLYSTMPLLTMSVRLIRAYSWLSAILGINTASQHKSHYNAILEQSEQSKKYSTCTQSYIMHNIDVYGIILIILANFMNIQMKWTVYGLAKWNSTVLSMNIWLYNKT